jgi:hypothetical protein
VLQGDKRYIHNSSGFAVLKKRRGNGANNALEGGNSYSRIFYTD